MCKAHVLRFCCGHGILMSLEPCPLGPCPMIKTCGEKLPQQPYRCYNCQLKREQRTSRPSGSERTASCGPEAARIDQRRISSFQRASTFPVGSVSSRTSVSDPLPNVAKQPAGCVQLNHRKSSAASSKSFTFACSSSSHFATPHYSGLPSFLPHQDHACPPCQLSALRQEGEFTVTRQARSEYPCLTAESLIRNGCIKEWQSKPSWTQYLDEKLTEERQMWFHVTRKWTQDLKKIRVLVSDEDGLGLME